MATLARSTRRVTSSPVAPHVTAACLWHALLKKADKEAVRPDLPAGSTHVVNLSVSGDIDGEPIDQPILGILTVGTDSTRATSSTPSLPAVVGHILGKLNEATREALLRDLPNDFEQGGGSFADVPEALAEKTAAMLVRLRAKKVIDVCGPVSFKPATVALAVVG